MPDSQGQIEKSYLRGASILAVSAIVAKIVGAIFKIPLVNIIGMEGYGHFTITYQVYTLLLALSQAGIPVALSRLTSAAAATGQRRLVHRYFSVALPTFAVIGAVFSALMFFFAPQLALFMADPGTASGIRVLSPAVFFCCVISVYEGFWQGHSNMVPTVIKQILEVMGKMIFGIAAAWFLISRGYDSPTVAAGAIIGVSIGLAITLPVLIIYKRRKGKELERTAYVAEHQARMPGRFRTTLRILKVSIPITLGAMSTNLLALIDTKFVMQRLQTGAGFDQTTAASLLGAYGSAQTIMQAPSAIIVPITISIIPAISGAIARKDHKEAKAVMESSMKLVAILALAAGIGMSVLSTPIFYAAYGDNRYGHILLAIFGAAAFFTCTMLMTTATLQATGHEKVPMVALAVSGAVSVAVDWVLVGNPRIGIVGSPIGSLCGYIVGTLINMTAIAAKVPDRPKLRRVYAKPFLCAVVMGVAAWAAYNLAYRLASPLLGTGRVATIAYLAVAIIVAVVVYLVLIVASKTITKEDMQFVPRGEKLARILRIR